MKKQDSARVSEPRCLNVEQAAAYLGCTVWAIRTLTWKNEIKAVTIGARLLFPKEELDRYIDQLKVTA